MWNMTISGKWATVLLTAAAILFAGGAGSAAEPDRETLTITRRERAVTVDGVLGEWRLKDPAIIRLDPEMDVFRGEAWFCWDRDFLYAAFLIHDRSPMKNAGDNAFEALKAGDRLDIFLSTNPKADPNRPEPAAGDYRLLMTCLRNENPVVFAYQPVGKGGPKYVSHPAGGMKTRIDEAGVVPDAQFAVVRNTEKGTYTAEARIPWRFLSGFRPRPGLKIPFCWAIHFSDTSGRKNTMKLWWNGSSTMCMDITTELRLHPGRWGWAVFGK